MTPNAKAPYSEALKLVEESRYKMGISPFLRLFIDHWAFYQTGVNRPSEEFPYDLGITACKLTHCLSHAMKLDPTSDILGTLFCETGFYKQGSQFYPTPTGVAALLSKLTTNPTHSALADEPLSFYEPCCGTGINTMLWLENLLEQGQRHRIKEAVLWLEDIDKTMIKSTLLQLLHYCESRSVKPKAIQLLAVDSISRKPSGLSYCATSSRDGKSSPAGK